MSSFNVVLSGSYDSRLVALSILIAVLGSYAALDLAGRVRTTRDGARLVWLIGGALAMGIGIWSMHFVGMMAFRLPVSVEYDWPTSLAALAIAVGGGAVALVAVARPRLEAKRATAGGVFLGGGMSGLHYLAMDSMRVPATCLYSWPLVTVSVGFGVAFSLVSLWVALVFRNEPTGRRLYKLGAAMLMALAICSMHYTGMAAASFTPGPLPDLTHAVGIPVLGAIDIGLIAVMVLGVTVMASVVDRLEQQNKALQASEERFRAAFADAAIGMAITDVAGRFVSVNEAFCRLTEYTASELLSLDWMAITHPDDRGMNLGLADRMHAGRLPTTLIEKRYMTKSGRTVWVRNSTSLLHDADGQPRHVIALVEDVSDQRKAEQKVQRSFAQLRALAARLQTVREEERTRLAREIHDEIGQALTAIKIDLSAWARQRAGDTADPADRARAMLTLVDETIQLVRRIATELRPGILDDLGLVAAIEWAAKEFQQRTGIACHASLPDTDITLDVERATAFFRIFQETLTNVARHAAAREVNVRLAWEDGALHLVVHDDGVGITDEQLAGTRSLGIVGMRERALLLGGEFTIDGRPDAGTTVSVRIPEVR